MRNYCLKIKTRYLIYYNNRLLVILAKAILSFNGQRNGKCIHWRPSTDKKLREQFWRNNRYDGIITGYEFY